MGCDRRLFLGILGCFGGLFIHLVIGSLYQWGIINIYITSYYRMHDSSVTLEGNAIAFPIMMLCIGLTMRFGLYIAENGVHALIIMSCVVLLQAGFVFASSYVPNMGGFIVVYGVLFGLVSGFNFMIPVVECNRFFPGKKMYVNGVVLTGTGLGSLVFGLFSYNFLNPHKLPPQQGYYLGSSELQAIAQKVPECLRWLSLLYLACGLIGVLLLSYVCVENRRTDVKVQAQAIEIVTEQLRKQATKHSIENNEVVAETSNVVLQNTQARQQAAGQIQIGSQNIQDRSKLPNIQPNLPIFDNKNPPPTLDSSHLGFPTTLKEAFCSKVWWIVVGITFFGSCGLFFLNGNYKTYVRTTINNDEMLTIIGVVSALGNGFSRFFWNLLFNHTGFRFVMVLNTILQIVIFIALRFTVFSIGGYLFCLFIAGCCMGGYLVMTPTVLQSIFGQSIGSNVYGFYWQTFGISNLIQYAFVSGLSKKIAFNGVIYICLGMTIFAGILIVFGDFHAPWNNPQDQMGYCKDWAEKKQEQLERAQQNQEQIQNP